MKIGVGKWACGRLDGARNTNVLADRIRLRAGSPSIDLVVARHSSSLALCDSNTGDPRIAAPGGARFRFTLRLRAARAGRGTCPRSPSPDPRPDRRATCSSSRQCSLLRLPTQLRRDVPPAGSARLDHAFVSKTSKRLPHLRPDVLIRLLARLRDRVSGHAVVDRSQRESTGPGLRPEHVEHDGAPGRSWRIRYYWFVRSFRCDHRGWLVRE